MLLHTHTDRHMQTQRRRRFAHRADELSANWPADQQHCRSLVETGAGGGGGDTPGRAGVGKCLVVLVRQRLVLAFRRRRCRQRGEQLAFVGEPPEKKHRPPRGGAFKIFHSEKHKAMADGWLSIYKTATPTPALSLATMNPIESDGCQRYVRFCSVGYMSISFDAQLALVSDFVALSANMPLARNHDLDSFASSQGIDPTE